jgi:hypothetical protein
MRLLRILLACTLAAPGLAAAQACGTDRDCDDHVFCNGAERCQPGAAGADARGCIAPPIRTPCMVGEICHEEPQGRCEVIREDRDSDGHWSPATGGDDCNDSDVNEFPGNAEVWDAADHDEDCNARTHGFTPGFGNVTRQGRFQACSGERVVTVEGTVGGEATFSETACANGTVCVSQPTGDGFCLPAPAGYTPGPVLAGPRGDQVRTVASTPPPAQAMPTMVRPPASVPRPAAARPAIVMPAQQAAPALAAPACIAPRMRDKTGACVLPPGTCPDGMVFDAKANVCVKK